MSLEWRRSVVIVCLAVTAGFCKAPAEATVPYSFDAWTFQNGLPQNTIRAICQTRDGYIWMTTNDGLTRFDGVRFQTFRSTEIAGIGTDRYSFSALFEDKDGALWAGSPDGGLVRYFHGQFRTFTTTDGLASNSIQRIDADEAGVVWIFCKQGLNQWKKGRLILIAPKAGSPFNDVLAPQPEHLGQDSFCYGLWRMTRNGWERFAFGKWTTFPLPPGVRSATALKVNSIFEDAGQNLWFSLMTDPALYYCLSKGKLEIIRGLPKGSFVSYRDEEGYLWISDHTARTGVWRNGRVFWFTDLHTPSLFHVLADRDGGIWIGTLQEGFYHVRSHLIDSFPHQAAPEIGSSLMAARNQTAVWIGSLGLQRYRPEGLETVLSPVPFQLKVVRAMAEDVDGSILLALPQGVRRFRHGRLETDPRMDAIKELAVAIRVSRTGAIWIGTVDGLYRIPASNEGDAGKLEKLANESVTTLFEDHRGQMWVGLQGGLSIYRDGELMRFEAASGWRYGPVGTIYEDSVGDMWMGTFGKGAIRLRNGVITSYTTAQGLPSDAINQILEDGRGFLWFGTEVGLIRLRRTELDELAAGRLTRVTATRFTKTADNQSLVADGFSQPNCLKRPDGKLWFSILGGVAVVDPKMLPLNPNPPAVVMEDCLVDHRAAPCNESVTMLPGQQNLEIAYTGLSFVRPDDITFKYRLEGADTAWQEVGSRRVAYYSHLSPGRYVFKVAAANSDGVWSNETRGLPVVVLPAFYRTWWFEVAICTLLAFAVWYAWRTRSLRFEKDRLAQQAFSRQLIASQESERKRIAAELHDSLGQRLLIMRSLALLQLQGLTKSGVAAPQLEELSEEAGRALGEVREISYDLRPYQLDRLGLTKAIEAVVQTAASASHTKFSAQIDNIDELFPEQSRINLYRIVQESLNNIIKHSGATEVTIIVERTGEQVRLIVRDNGKGFAVDAARPDSAKGGFGLVGIAERAELLGGKTEIISTPGKGTVIKIEFDTRGIRHGR